MNTQFLFVLFPSIVKSMLKKMGLIKNSQLGSSSLIFVII